MAWNYNNSGGDEGKISPFQDGDYKQRRKDELKKEIHELWKNPLMNIKDNSGVLIYAYRIIFENLNALYSEINEDLNDTEKQELKNTKNHIDRTLIFSPPHWFTNDYARKSSKINFSRERWFELKKKLFDYQLLIFRLEVRHSANAETKNKEKEY